MRGEESREERGEKRGGGEKRGEEVKYGYQYTLTFPRNHIP